MFATPVSPRQAYLPFDPSLARCLWAGGLGNHRKVCSWPASCRSASVFARREQKVEESLSLRRQILGVRSQKLLLRNQHLGIDGFKNTLDHARSDFFSVISWDEPHQLIPRGYKRELHVGDLQCRHAVDKSTKRWSIRSGQATGTGRLGILRTHACRHARRA
jgi:hypothetical protein